MAEKIFHPDGITNRVKVIAGEVSLDGSNPTSISYGGKIRTVLAVVLTILDGSAPGVGTDTLTYSVDLTNKEVDIHAWKVTSNTNPTTIASTGTETISYVIFGY